ncbi:MAG: acyl-CoA dehydrogenase, partial [Curvibacter sp.]
EVQRRFDQLRALTRQLVQTTASHADRPYWVADDFLQALALALLGWAGARLETSGADWQAPARALQAWVLPEFALRLQIIEQQITPTGTAS